MGRKPNQLILEFFERGPKLEDASNRYQHTCKACGEKFPKGRIDSLTNHLVKKCQAIPVADRQRALLQLHELPTTIDPSSTTTTKANGNGVPSKNKDKDLPFAGRSPWGSGAGLIGLDALAEASRQVDASAAENTKQAAYNGVTSAQSNGSRKAIIVDPALENMAFHFRPDSSDGDGQFISAPSLPSIQYFQQNLSNSPSTSPHLPELSLATPSAPNARQSSQLSLIAASASEMMPNTAFPLEPDVGIATTDVPSRLFDGQPGMGPKSSATWPMPPASPENIFFEQPTEQPPVIEPIVQAQRAQTYPRPIAPNSASTPQRGFVNDFGTTKSSKPKVRGRFNPIRRKEVQEVRKQGACIRCRMLKKPCSGDTPCTTCQNVDSPRMWKHGCIRTRLADEFEAWASGLHATLTWVDVNSVKNEVTFAPYSGRIEVTHFDDPCIFVIFTALAGQKPTFAAVNQNGTQSVDHTLAETLLQTQQSTVSVEHTLSPVTILDSENDDLPAKLSLYMRAMSSAFYEREISTFMKPTLMVAAELSVSKQDTLLSRALELWTATHILGDRDDLRWIIHSNTILPPVTSQVVHTEHLRSSKEPSDGTESNAERVSISETESAESYDLMCSQLRAGIEKRVVQLSKSVISDLERRLLLRQQSDWFATFLVALILLNCVERTCWSFLSWNEEKNASRWPLDRSPSFYAGQADRFSDILHMQLKMRGLPTKTAPRPDSGVLKPVENNHEVANQWYETVQLTTSFLEQRPAAEFDIADSRSLDLKYGALLLLPTTCYT